ncbi:hypothetical protein IRJ41_010378 [Triplophysa rosa]|uniref:Uncharacterized protein n=1 Tax=Triplophysa rosa TaxID=992332 RepID=A0A9W7WR00_TRIRA|nr:hypothetical protein IRJ41_010378 [Triplophysa rosa]
MYVEQGSGSNDVDLDVVFVWMTEDHLESFASVWDHADCSLVKHRFIHVGLLCEPQFVHM